MIYCIYATYKTVKSSIHWHFWRNILFLLVKNALLKIGPKISGMGRPPPPSFGQCPKENVFFPLMSSLSSYSLLNQQLPVKCDSGTFLLKNCCQYFLLVVFRFLLFLGVVWLVSGCFVLFPDSPNRIQKTGRRWDFQPVSSLTSSNVNSFWNSRACYFQ